MRILLLALCLPACAYSVLDNQDDATKTVVPSTQKSAPEETVYTDSPRPVDPDACVPQHFAADAIPYGFKLDPSCPPDIYAPPRWIPPWDPGPVIK
jgi:hypothetical protein